MYENSTKGRTFPILSISAVSAAQNTPMVKRMFRQGPDHISALSQRAVGEYQAQHSTGGLSGGGGWPERLCMERDHDRLPELSHSASDGSSVYLWQMDKQENSPAKHTSQQATDCGGYVDK